jgi:hypothetical protein
MGVQRAAGRAGSAALAAALLLATAGCSGGSGGNAGASGSTTTGTSASTATASGPAGGTDAGMFATVVHQRLDVGTTRIGLEVTTDHHTSLHVDGVQLLTDAFASQPITDKDTDFVPDRTIDLTVDYGRPVCDPGVTPDDAQVLVRYTVAGDYTEQTQQLPVKKLGLTLLNHLHTSGCAEQRLDEAASLTYGSFHRQVVDGRLSLVGTLDLERPADGGSGDPVVIEAVLGSVLFEFVGMADHPPVGELPRGKDVARVPVLIRGNDRCSAHERSAAQQVFVFTTDVRVGNAPVHREIIEPPKKLQVQSLALLDDVCR